MKFWVEEAGKTVLSGDSCEYQVEVDHGGWGGQQGDGMLVSAIIRTASRSESDPNHWETVDTIHLSLDREAAEWLSDALARVASRSDVGLRKLFS